MNKSYILAAVAAFVGLSPMISAETRTMCDTVTLNRGDDLKWNKKAIQVSIARNKKEVTIDTKSKEYKGGDPYGVTRSRMVSPVSVETDGDVKKFSFTTEHEVRIFSEIINRKKEDQDKYDDIALKVATGHEETHAYDNDKMPLLSLHDYLIKKVIANVSEQNKLQSLKDDITISMEARAVFNQLLTYASYLKQCQIAGKDAYRKLPNMPVKDTVITAAVLKNMTDAQLLYFAHDTFVKQYGTGKIAGTTTSYVDAFKGYFSPNPLQYAINLGFNFQPAKEGYVTPGRVMQLDPKQQDKLLKQYEEYEKFAMEMLQKYQGDPRIAFENSQNTMELAIELFVLHPCHLVEILERVQDKDSAEAVSAASDALLPQWLDHFNAIKAKSDVAPDLSSDEAMVFMFKVIPMRNQVYQKGLMPTFERLRHANYYNSASLKDCVQKSESALINLNNELSNSAKKGAKEFLGQ